MTQRGNNGVSVIVPTLNEEANVAELINRTSKALTKAGFVYEIVFVDDRSTDATCDIIAAHSATYPVHVHLKRGSRGKAQSLVEGFSYAKYPVLAVIDADLQYAPEELPAMLRKLGDGNDVIQSRRVTNDSGWLRNAASKCFNFFFIRLLHGLDLDTQSGLKVFRREVLDGVALNPTPWTFDLEFLINAKHGGFRIASHDIHFAERHGGESKIGVLSASREIGWNALKLKMSSVAPRRIHSEHPATMRGAGHVHKGKRYVTHSTLNHEVSAINTLVPWQKVFAIGLLAAVATALALFPLKSLVWIMAVLSVIYFSDVLFNFYVVAKSLNAPPELSFTRRELDGLDYGSLPKYTILCPLYREAHVLPGFLAAIAKLDWPKRQLDVQLLLEEDDQETIAVARGMDLPPYVRVVVVPHSMPKTKPKACNYGLTLATGDYLVIYDAEDVPEPDQLKKAYLGFQRSPREVVCLQAKLNYFNPHHNLLTRLFTAEYSLWFDVILPGLQSMNGYIPLGGTSNHFRTGDLNDLQGWDPFNVTEDCDLGARLFKRGSRTAIIDSTTLEEANSNVKNWIRQRSRWIKGYMMTYLVHMRRPVEFFRNHGIHAAMFQLVVGGKIAFMLINPLLWALTVTYFAARATAGPLIEQLFPPAIFYIAVVSLVAGNFLYLYYYMVGCAKRGHWRVIKYVYLVPAYWLLTSVAAVMAFYQLITKPHFWEKTNHGLHLKKAAAPAPAAAGGPEVPAPQAAARPAWLSGALSGAGLLMVAMSAVNFVNFLFNAYLGRVLTFEQLALVTFVNTLWSMLGLFLNPVGTTLIHKVAGYIGAGVGDKAAHFYRRTMRSSLVAVVGLSLAWLALAPVLARFFNISDVTVLLLFTPVISLGLVGKLSKSYIEGFMYFKTLSVLLLLETAIKFGGAVALVSLGYNDWVYLSILASIAATAAVSYLVAGREAGVKSLTTDPFPKSFFLYSVFTGLSLTVFLSLDIMLVKHYLPERLAGEYVLLALVGKMVYFFASLPNNFTVNFISRDAGSAERTRRILYYIGGATLALVAVGYVFLATLGRYTVPFLLGDKTLAILPYLQPYVVAISLFALSKVIVSYHLAKENYAFPVASLAMSAYMTAAIAMRHGGVGDIVDAILASSVFGFGLIMVMHYFEDRLFVVSNAVRDFLGAFRGTEPTGPGRRILVFNWRDTRHAFAGGAEVYVHEIAKRWVRDGNYVTLFCGNDGQSPRNEDVDGVHVVRRGGFYFVYLWAFIYYFTQFRGRYDIIIDCQNGIPFFTPLYVKEPVFCVLHHVHQEVFRKYLPRPLAALAAFLERRAMPVVYRNTRFITVSDSTKREMVQLGLHGSGIEIVHNGVDLRSLRPGPKSIVPTVLYLGRLKAYKSVDVLIRAFARVKREVGAARLVIAGSGEDGVRLKALAAELGLSDSVEFTGRISDQDKVRLLQAAWVFVNPSLIEGWGITTIEANACGTPIVAADVPGLRDSVRSTTTGYLVPYGDHEAFADRIIEIINDTKLRAQMSREAYTWAQNFDWIKSAQKLKTALEYEINQR